MRQHTNFCVRVPPYLNIKVKRQLTIMNVTCYICPFISRSRSMFFKYTSTLWTSPSHLVSSLHRTLLVMTTSWNITSLMQRCYKISFYPRAIPLWNQLPVTAVSATSGAAFKGAALPAIQVMLPPQSSKLL